MAVEMLGVWPHRGATTVGERGGIPLRKPGVKAVVRIPVDVGASAWHRFRVSFAARPGADNAPAAVRTPDITTNQVFKDDIPVARTPGYASVRLTSELQAAVHGSRAANVEVDHTNAAGHLGLVYLWSR